MVPRSISRVKCQFPRDETWQCHEMRRGIYTRRGTWHLHAIEGVTFTRDVVVLTKLNNRQASSCL